MADRRLLFKRNRDALIPADDFTVEALRGWEEFEPMAFTAPQGNIDLRKWRLLWAIASAVTEQGDHFDSEDAMDHILILARHTKTTVNPFTGEVTVKAASFSPASLAKEDRFERLFRRCLHVVEHEILPGIESEDLRRRIGEIMDGKDGQRMREQQERFG